MNPQSNEQSGMQLPAPVMEQAPAMPAQLEQQPVLNMGQAPAQAQPQLSPLPAAPAPQQATQNDVSTTTNNSSTMLADDGDLIEKEWVNKAKAIVERNRDDPYKQSEELTAVKADYLKQRYNKTIKLNS